MIRMQPQKLDPDLLSLSKSPRGVGELLVTVRFVPDPKPSEREMVAKILKRAVDRRPVASGKASLEQISRLTEIESVQAVSLSQQLRAL